ncbi:hypothetical protein [Actinoplanes sp. NPDC049681]|uniref:hypothetical protein n=1 Tax=Actinoplanes sp. NPDC049681 TaxID=3363905 RepID=UPI00378D12E0
MRLAGLLLCGVLLAGCDEAAPPAVPSVAPSALPSPSPGATPSKPAPRSAPPVRLPVVTVPVLTSGWEVTVYYTAVEAYHSGEAETVTGCPRIDCAHGDQDLGAYKSDFVAAVREEGAGRTAGGAYLNWSHDVGFWLDTRPRDTGGRALRPFVSAAADPGVLARGTQFRIADCGHADDGSRPAAKVCAALRAARWTVTDEFTPGLGGSKHIDAYIGEETGPDFTSSPWYLTLQGATLRRG